jgi:hypothetical protein
VYTVFKQLQDGVFVHVASRDEYEQAVQLMEALNSHWPGDYVVRDSQGNAIDLTKSSVMSPTTALRHPSASGCN